MPKALSMNKEKNNRTCANLTVMDTFSACHPFFTGKQKLIDTAGRIEKFKKKYANHLAAKKK